MLVSNTGKARICQLKQWMEKMQSASSITLSAMPNARRVNMPLNSAMGYYRVAAGLSCGVSWLEEA
jgi:hypothetical protein